jgi:hypothetical protein
MVGRDFNNLAQLLQATNRLGEAEPLFARSLVILLKFTRFTGHIHPRLQTVFRNYSGLLAEMGLSQEEFENSISALGVNAGFDGDGYWKLVEQILR